MQPYLFIGVGGSGGKTLRYVWRELDRRLVANGWDKAHLPRCFGFLHIDLPYEYDGGAETDIPIVKDLETTHYLGLGSKDVPYANYDRRAAEGTRVEGLVRWRPWDPKRIPSPGKGAGQRRAVGRVVSVLQQEEISAAVTRAMNALVEGDAHSDLRQLANTLPDGDVFGGSGHVVVIGSLAGGSGSGIFLDVVEAVSKATTAFGGNADPQTILLAPDVFTDIGPDAGIYPNALAALAELVNASESTGILPSPEQELRNGPLRDVAGARLGRSNFLVGASNGDVTFKSVREVYEAVGRMLGALALNPRHQQPLDQYIDVNAAVTPVGRNLGDSAACTSVGYAVVGLGRHLFQQYAAERLARRAYERLVAGHDERDPDVPSEVRLARAVDARWDGGFLAATGLSEMGAESNQVIDALRSLDDVKGRVQAMKNDVLESIRGRVNKFTGKDWLTAHDGEFKSPALKLEEFETNERHRRAKEWTDTIQVRLVEAVVKEAATYGVPVALRLLQRLDEDIENSIADLRKEVDQHREKERKYASNARSVLMNLVAEFKGNAEEHDKSSQLRGSALLMRFEAETASLAADLLADVRANLLPPLRTALRGFLDRLQVAATQEPTKSTMLRWSSNEVPPHLQPAANELLIEAAGTFPATLERLLSELFEGTQAFDAVKKAAEEIITGDWPAYDGSPHGQTLVSSLASWEPQAGAARWADAAASTAEFRIGLTADQLPRRAGQWLAQRQGPVSEFLAQSLAGYLNDQAAAGRNTNAFLDAFTLALSKSRPFVFVDSDVSMELHGGTGEATYTSVSTIPVAAEPGTALYDSLVQALTTAGIDPGGIVFDASSRVADVDVIRYPTIKFHPAALKSVTGPIAEDWGNRQGHDVGRADFWNCRRSRTLEAYVPLPREQLMSLVSGYFLAATLGYIDLPADELWSAKQRHVWSPDGLLSLPRYVLAAQGREPRSAKEVLPALLESFPLSWLAVTADHSVLPAYERLMELGTIHDGRCHSEVVHWITSGERERGTVPHPSSITGIDVDDSADASQRREALATRLGGVAVTLSERSGKPLKSAVPPRDVDGLREITGIVAEALSATVDSLPSGGDVDADPLI